MKIIYDLFIHIISLLLPIIGVFNNKIKLGSQGRVNTWSILSNNIKHTVPKIWVHAASLGEYEQIVPILERIDQSQYQIVLTFFSPSGYVYKHNTNLAHTVCYLPIDTPSNASKFIAAVDPSLAIMVKYEFWPNYLDQLHHKQIHTLLVSAIFRPKMIFNSWYGRWMTKYLNAFDYFFVQDQQSLDQLKQLGFTNASVSGDTRFDRAYQLTKRDNTVPQLDTFVHNKPCIVIGSSWPEDIDIMTQWLQNNNVSRSYQVIIAPHQVSNDQIKQLKQQLGFDTLNWSTINDATPEDLAQASTLIIDTIGLLTKAYSYASIAYVGGGMGTSGLHNILEPATYGVPVIIGNNYQKFPEATRLLDLGGLFTVSTTTQFNQVIDQLSSDQLLLDKTGMICEQWINNNTGASQQVINYLKQRDEKLVID